MVQTFRNKMATSTFTLPVVSVLTFIVWVTDAAGSRAMWISLLFAALTAYALAEWNNRYGLLRIRSRFVSTSFLLLMCASPFLHTAAESLAPALCLAVSYLLLFACYQQPRSQGKVFHAFLSTGIATMLTPVAWLLVAPQYIFMTFQLRCLTWRTFVAGLLGLAVPYWCSFVWSVFTGDLATAALAFADNISGACHAPLLAMPHYALLSLPEKVVGIYLAALSVIGIFHYFRTSYNDRIRVRMFFHSIIINEIFLLAAAFMLPQHFAWTFPLLLVNSAPLIAHYWTLARGRGIEIWFWAMTILYICIAVATHIL